MRLILCALILAGGTFVPSADADPPIPSPELDCAGVFEPVDDPDGPLQAALEAYLAAGSGSLGAGCPGDPLDAALPPTDLSVEPPGTTVPTDPVLLRDVTLRVAVQINGRPVDTGAVGQITGTGDRWHTVRDQASQPWWEFRMSGVTTDAFQFDMAASHLVPLIGRFYAEFRGTASFTVPAGGPYGPSRTPPDVTINLRFVGFRLLRPAGA